MLSGGSLAILFSLATSLWVTMMAALDPQGLQTNRFANRGQDLILQSVYAVLEKQPHLLSKEAEHITQRIVSNNNDLLAEIGSLQKGDQQMPSHMPFSVSENPNL